MINKIFFFFFIFLIFNIANGSERSDKEIRLGVFLDDLDDIGSFEKFCFAILASQVSEPGLGSLKNGISEKNAAQKWPPNRLALNFRTFSVWKKIGFTILGPNS